jgi:hypothetical protein
MLDKHPLHSTVNEERVKGEASGLPFHLLSISPFTLLPGDAHFAEGCYNPPSFNGRWLALQAFYRLSELSVLSPDRRCVFLQSKTLIR